MARTRSVEKIWKIDECEFNGIFRITAIIFARLASSREKNLLYTSHKWARLTTKLLLFKGKFTKRRSDKRIATFIDFHSFFNERNDSRTFLCWKDLDANLWKLFTIPRCKKTQTVEKGIQILHLVGRLMVLHYLLWILWLRPTTNKLVYLFHGTGNFD